MAKWGEGDPRWIVEDRPDATNVNNWHWSEKDASGWSKDKFKELLLGLEFQGPEGKCQTVEVEQCKGEATANNRKGKLIFFYEWNIKLKWEGKVTPPAPDPDDVIEEVKECSGQIEIPNVSEENEVHEIDVEVSSKNRDKDSMRLKELLRKVAPDMIRDQIGEYLRCLKEEFSQGLILPKRDSQQSTTSTVSTATATTPRQNSLSTSKAAARPSGSPVGCRIYTARVTMSDRFMASVEEVYSVLTTQEMVEAFTHCPATVDAYRGGVYSIMNGHITGEFVEVNRPTKIVQKWRLNSWPEGHHSTVTIELKQESSGTLLTLLQTEVPEAESERTKDGWKRYIFESIKNTFGYGAQLF